MLHGPPVTNGVKVTGPGPLLTRGNVIWRGDDQWTRFDQPSGLTSWTHSVRPSGFSERVGLSLVTSGLPTGPPPIDPTAMLRELRELDVPMTEGGPWMIDGYDTTVYTATVAPDRLLSSSDMNVLIGSDTLATLALYVDDNDRVRRVEMSDFSGLTHGGDLRIDLSQFGTPVAVTAPPAEQVSSG
jgi:hypothetical protein